MVEQRILIIEHNFRERTEMTRFFEDNGYKVDALQDGYNSLDIIKEKDFILVVADIAASGFSALKFLKTTKDIKPSTEIIILSEEPLIEDAVNLMKHGALDFFVKPVSSAQIELCLKKTINKHKEIYKSENKLGGDSRNSSSDNQNNQNKNASVEIITSDKGMQRVLNMAKRVADSSASVLIQGESGTGKELFARFIYQNSKRYLMPFIALNCAALPENLLESELFGHEKGAFTGAVSRKMGRFELADNGTLFLDEITEMDYHLQAKLLRVVQEKMVDRLGSTESIPIDVRIIASTNRNIKDAIKNGQFREDLYHRLNTIPLIIPPLRERSGDLNLLCTYFIKKYNNIDARDVKGMTPEAYKMLSSQKFTGNVRELENIIHRAVLLAEKEFIEPQDLLIDDFYDTDNTEDFYDENLDKQEPLEFSENNDGDTSELPYNIETDSLKEVEEKMIYHTLERTEGNRTHAAKLLGISVRTLRNKLNEYKQKV